MTHVKQVLSSFPVKNNYSFNPEEWSYIVANKQSILAENLGMQKAENVLTFYEFDLNGSKENKTAFSYEVKEALERTAGANIVSKYITRDRLMVTYGGVLFFSIVLTSILLMQTVISIYYKQISEGYDDKYRFQILKKVGMGERERKELLRYQVLIVFFSPLIVSIFHIVWAFPMIADILAMANMDNIPLMIGCTFVCILLFTLFYGLVFTMTNKSYNRIIK